MEKLVHRVQHMEQLMNAVESYTRLLGTALHDLPAMDKIVAELWDYYDSGQWIHDYEADEAGQIPQDLPRGVLSEDGLYNVLGDYQNVRERLIPAPERIEK